MSNNIVNFKSGGLPATMESLAAGIGNVMAETSSVGGFLFMKLDRGSGIFVFGQEDIEIEEGSLWAVNVFAAEHGFISWGDGVVLGETMVPLAQPRPLVNDLPETGEKWDEQFSLQLQCLSGEDAGVECIYKGTSIGYKKMFNVVMAAVGQQLAANSEEVIPVVTLASDSYKHKKYGKIYTPEMLIQKFVANTDEAPEVADVEEAPKTSRRTRS